MIKPKKTLIMRVSPETSQERIEDVTSEEWQVPVRFNKKFPTVLDSNEIYWMKRSIQPKDDEAPPEPELPEDGTGLRAIGHQITRLVRPVGYTRSLSVDDLGKLAPDVVPTTDLIPTWVIEFDHTVTQIFAPENASVETTCDRAALDIGLWLKDWRKRVERWEGVITVHCTSPDLDIAQDSIQFGN
jgi:hypothetical protein